MQLWHLSVLFFILLISGCETLSSKLLFNKSVNQLEKQLPSVRILPINRHFYRDLSSNVTLARPQTLLPHYHDALFLLWLNNTYRHTIGPRQSSSREVFYFVPSFIIYSVNKPASWWNALDNEIERVKAHFSDFLLDKTFMAASDPRSTMINPHRNDTELFFSTYRRNLADLHMLRVDNDRTLNGRDVMVPYFVPKHLWSKNISAEPTRRKYFISAFCNEAAGIFPDETKRLWRNKVYQQWWNVSDSIVSADRVPRDQFEHYYANSDFCIIVPGDTSSTAKLYKAIFAGCIPVIFVSFPAQLPFYQLVDWSRFAIVVYKDVINYPDKMTSLLNYLMAVRQSRKELKVMKLCLQEASTVFDYGKVRYPSVYHFTLLSLVQGTNSKNIYYNLNSKLRQILDV